MCHVDLFKASSGYLPVDRLPSLTFHLPEAEHLLLPSGITGGDVARPVLGVRVKRQIPHFCDSLVFGRPRSLLDAGCFMGRSFRAGWGPGWTIVHSGSMCGHDGNGGLADVCILSDLTCVAMIHSGVDRVGSLCQEMCCGNYCPCSLSALLSRDISILVPLVARVLCLILAFIMCVFYS